MFLALKKLSLTFFIFLSLLLSVTTFAPDVFAQAPPPQVTISGAPFTADTFKAPEAISYSSLNGWDATIPCFGLDITLIASGPNGFRPCPRYDATGNLVAGPTSLADATRSDHSIIGGLNNAMLAMVDTPPATVGEYVASVGQNMGLIPKAYAQVGGSGNSVIQPVFAIWQVMRDVSYIGFIFVFIIIGFMIMFRQRLNPQTVVTFQSALPGLVVGLALVTFSYFIAAFLIDVSFIMVQLVGALFIQSGLTAVGGQPVLSIAQRSDIFDLYKVFVLNGETINTVAAPIISSLNNSSGGISLQGIAIGALSALLPGGSLTLGGGISSLITTILIIAVVFQMIRLVWGLLQAYIAIFINTILGPLFILYSTLPGRRGALTFWWKNILGNALIFPAVFAAILFAGYIVQSPATSFNSSMPFLAFPEGFLRAILAFGIVLGTPSIPKTVKSALGVKDLGDFAAAAIAGAALGYGAASGAANFAYSGAMDKLGIPARRKAMQEADAKAGKYSGAYNSSSLRDVWAKHGPGK